MILGYYNMCSRLTISTDKGDLIIDGSDGGGGIISAAIDINTENLTNKAVVTLPRKYKFFEGKKLLDYIAAGNAVKLELGYNGALKTEFEGYINLIGSDIPVSLELDGKLYPYRKTNFKKAYLKASLKQVLNDLFPELEVDAPDMDLGKFTVDNASAYDVLVKLNGAPYSLLFDIDATAKKIKASYLSLQTPAAQPNVYYLCDEVLPDGFKKIRGNIKQHDLKYSRKDDLTIQFEAKGILPSGKKISVIVGDKGEGATKRTLNMGTAKSEAELKAAAERELARVKFDGFTGSMTGFGAPVTHSGDAVELIDFEFPEHNGTYYVAAEKINYSVSSGFERVLNIKYKLS